MDSITWRATWRVAKRVASNESTWRSVNQEINLHSHTHLSSYCISALHTSTPLPSDLCLTKESPQESTFPKQTPLMIALALYWANLTAHPFLKFANPPPPTLYCWSALTFSDQLKFPFLAAIDTLYSLLKSSSNGR